MKKWILILLMISLCLSLLACEEKEAKIQEPVEFYYLRTEMTHGAKDSVMKAEGRESAGHQGDHSYLLSQYLQGPTSLDLYSPFPAGTTLVNLSIVSNHAMVTLSNDICRLSGMELTVACACITMTLTEMTSATTVQIRAESLPLGESGSIIMDRNSILLLDDAAMQPAQ